MPVCHGPSASDRAGTMLDELNRLSVTAARARGLPEWKVLLKCPARLAVNPVVSTIGFDVNRIFSELPIVALVLGLPELGELFIQSYLDLDMYVAGAFVLLVMGLFRLFSGLPPGICPISWEIPRYRGF